MPRRARIKVAGIPHHVIQRGNNRSPCFFVEEDYRFYLRYRELFRHHLDDKDLAQIRTSVNGGLVLGEERFKDKIEGVVARRVRPGKSGRPKKSAQSGAAS